MSIALNFSILQPNFFLSTYITPHYLFYRECHNKTLFLVLLTGLLSPIRDNLHLSFARYRHAISRRGIVKQKALEYFIVINSGAATPSPFLAMTSREDRRRGAQEEDNPGWIPSLAAFHIFVDCRCF